MLAIRMQRTGRKGHAQFRIVVQDSRQTPSSARVVARIGHYNPHTKEAVIDTEKAKLYLKNGAQPSDRVISLLKKEAVKMPSWVEPVAKQKKATKNPEKLRKNRPAKPIEKEEPPVKDPEVEATNEPADSAVESKELKTEASAEEKMEPTIDNKEPETKDTSETAAKPAKSETKKESK